MNVSTALKKIDELTSAQLRHMIQVIDIEIVNYHRVTENYTPDQMLKYGTPFLRRLEDQKITFENKLKEK